MTVRRASSRTLLGALALVVLASCGGNDAPPLFGGPVTHSFESTADVRRFGELVIETDCVLLRGNAGDEAIYLAAGYGIAGLVGSASVIDRAGVIVANDGDRVFVDGASQEDGGIPCDEDRGIERAIIAGAIGTCTPEECD